MRTCKGSCGVVVLQLPCYCCYSNKAELGAASAGTVFPLHTRWSVHRIVDEEKAVQKEVRIGRVEGFYGREEVNEFLFRRKKAVWNLQEKAVGIGKG